MKHINESRIAELLAEAGKAAPPEIERILAKSRSLQRLSLGETAALLAIEDEASLEKIYQAAAYVKDTIYGRRVVLFAPLYISNLCSNACLYCAFKSDNALTRRRALTVEEIKEQTSWLLTRGHKRILIVSGEPPEAASAVDYYTDAVKAVYSAGIGPHRIKRANINVAPLSVGDFRKLKASGIGTYQLFQETYHEATYRRVHPKGPKSDPDNRIDAVDRAFTAGIDDVGVGVLYGLYDYRFETLALLAHVEHLEKTFNVGPHTISVPRIEPACGSELSLHAPYPVSDGDFKKLVAVLRLAVPYTGIILSTRENAAMRDELLHLGVSQMSAESCTSPGGYATESGQQEQTQFDISDQRSLDEVAASLIAHGFIPSFCAACYRTERTGEAFMNLARPGTIKEKCSLNALITLKEYLDDFGSEKVRIEGYKMIQGLSQALKSEDKRRLSRFFEEIDKGVRDRYV